MKHEYCRNCMDEIIGEPIIVEEERTFKVGEEGMMLDYDAPVIIYFCCKNCQDEFSGYKKLHTNGK